MTSLLGSRPRVIVMVLAVLLMLDVGRSLYARLGHARPTELWQPPREAYAALAWPPGSDVPASAPPGRRLYVRWCATCHGPDGRGNGPAAPSLIPRPRDLTLGVFKYKSTPADQPPTDDDLHRVVASGLQASAMPYFRDLLNADEIRDVVAHVKTLSSAFAGPAPQPVRIPPERIAGAVTGGIPRPDLARLADPAQGALVERGRYLFTVASCALCHGADGAGGAKLSWRVLGTVWARNLTPDREAGLGAWSDGEIARAVRSGIAKDGRILHWQAMIWDHASNWDKEDVRALVAFLRTLPPVRRVIPAPRPPAADDCDVYTFWADRSTVPGCR